MALLTEKQGLKKRYLTIKLYQRKLRKNNGRDCVKLSGTVSGNWPVHFDGNQVVHFEEIRHTGNKWVLLYIQRWLVAPLQLSNGKITQ